MRLFMKRKQILKLDDLTLDQKVKIQGTQFDRKRKLKDKDWKRVRKLIKKGFNYDQIAAKYGVTAHCIRYGLDEEYRLHSIAIRSGKHTGIDTCTFENRVEYKRYLIRKRKIKAKTIV